MPSENVEWLPALVMLAAGVLAGAVIAWRARRPRVAQPAGPPVEGLDLAARRDALVEQLQELEATAAKRTPEQLAEERYALELEAARVWREMEGPAASKPGRKEVKAVAAAGPEAGGAAPAPAPAPTPASALRGFLWGLGAAGAIGLLLFLVTRSATERTEGSTVTGNTAPTPDAEADAERTRLEAAVLRDPGDIESRLQLAELALGRQDMMEVFNQTRAVLDRSPGHPRALSYQALVRLEMGQPETAVRMLKQALGRDPDLVEGYLHLAFVYVQMGRFDEAKAAIDEAARRHPDRAEQLRAVLAEMRARAEGQPPVTETSEDPHARVPEAVGSAGAGKERAAAADARAISGAVELDPALKGRVPPGALVFVIVRPAGAQGGPPLAVKRLVATDFPLRFQVGAADSMMGEALPDRLRVEARVDTDGDPLTRNPEDPTGSLDAVSAGAHDLRLVLKR